VTKKATTEGKMPGSARKFQIPQEPDFGVFHSPLPSKIDAWRPSRESKQVSRAYLGWVVEFLQGASRPLPAADVHTKGVPPHD